MTYQLLIDNSALRPSACLVLYGHSSRSIAQCASDRTRTTYSYKSRQIVRLQESNETLRINAAILYSLCVKINRISSRERRSTSICISSIQRSCWKINSVLKTPV
ncbi:unnamed protein product [Albugo candida]|uniref:Uncharacterized protein n=1 Tax=Albugo candida TaxID=65357 RepID=A0A024GT28_9STRA|nr:unnamed protein product [Albugo candida]|eukprot:CCI49495.1 unnamed protein product [Albugo candida]